MAEPHAVQSPARMGLWPGTPGPEGGAAGRPPGCASRCLVWSQRLRKRLGPVSPPRAARGDSGLARLPARSCLIAVAALLISTVTTSLGRRRVPERQELSRDFASPCLCHPGSQLGCVGRTGPRPDLAAGSHLLTEAGSFRGEPPPSARFLLRPLRRGPRTPFPRKPLGRERLPSAGRGRALDRGRGLQAGLSKKGFWPTPVATA